MIFPPPPQLLFKKDWNYYEVKLHVKSALFSADNSLTSSAAVLLGNAALSLEWFECRKKYLYSKECRGIYLVSLLLLMYDSNSERPLWLNAVKNVFFERAPRRLLLFDAKAIRGGAISITCDRKMCFSKERRGAYFCPTYIEGVV